jgi:hypothetical protein
MSAREPEQAYGPHMPPMIAWQRAGEPGWPFNWHGGPLPGTIGYKLGEQFALVFDEPAIAAPARDIEDNEAEAA